MDLVLGRDAGEHADAVDLAHRLLVAQGAEVGAGHGAARDAQLARDGLRRHGVVAGDHADLDAGRMRGGDGVLRGRSRRVHDANDREQRQSVECREQVRVRIERGRVEVLLAGGHDTQAHRAEALVLRQVRVPDVGHGRLAAIGSVDAHGPCQQLVRRALHVGPHDVLARGVLHGVERGHHLVGRVERERGDTRVLLPRESRVHAALGGEDDQRALRRVSHERPVPDLRIGTQRHGQQVLLERHVGLAAGVGDLSARRVAVTGDGVAPAGDGHLDGGHLVEGEGSRLVGVERRGRSERLHRAQALHDGPGLGKHLRALGEDGRRDGRERRGDGGDRERDRAQEQLLRADAPVHAEQRGDRQRDACDDEDLVGERVQLLRQRRLLDPGGLEHVADVADLGGHARGRHEDGSGATGDLGVHERHVHAVPESSIRGDRIDLLGRGDALARERRLVDLQGRGGEDAGVGRDQVAGLDAHDVTRDEVRHRDLDEVAVAPHLGLDDHHLLEGRGTRLRLAFLAHRQPGVEQREPQQEDARVELAGQEQADDARRKEHDLHRVGVLAAERLPERRLLRHVEGVAAVLRAPSAGLGRRQAGGRIDLEPARDLVRCQGVPADIGRSLVGSAHRACRRVHDSFSFGAFAAILPGVRSAPKGPSLVVRAATESRLPGR